MGAGHIGSTVLDVVLGAHPNFESVGEIWKLHSGAWMGESTRDCACGSSPDRCVFWPQVRRAWAAETGGDDVAGYVRLQGLYEGNRYAWPRLLRNRRWPTPRFDEYIRKTEALYRAIQQTGGKPVIVDSSLSPRRAFVLSMVPGVDLFLIHLVRDGRGVIWSLKNPAKHALVKTFKPASALRTTKYWITANLQSAFSFSRVRPERRQRIRYEDFATDPRATLARIGAWLGEDLSTLVTSDHALQQPVPVRHTVRGNRVRMLKEIKIRADFAWREHLPGRDRALFWLLAGWLAARYGYSKHPG
jgi:hypothetical protein